jgi:hypothetical protein
MRDEQMSMLLVKVVQEYRDCIGIRGNENARAF